MRSIFDAMPQPIFKPDPRRRSARRPLRGGAGKTHIGKGSDGTPAFALTRPGKPAPEPQQKARNATKARTASCGGAALAWALAPRKHPATPHCCTAAPAWLHRHGIIRLPGTFTSITFIDSTESWHGFTAGIANVVPEPATWAMMIAGFGLVGVAARRRRLSSAAA